MAFNKLVPVLYTEAIEASIKFYEKWFGFTCSSYDNEVGWASMVKDQVEVMFSIPNKHLPYQVPTFTGSIYIHANGVEEIWHKVKDHLKISYPLEVFDYGMKEFAVYDNNGYLIQF